jgi:thiamine pyrophosphate-dependent acetolactate synthase large subunit-like protein
LFGWEGHRVASADAFEGAFEQALASDRPSVIEVAQEL